MMPTRANAPPAWREKSLGDQSRSSPARRRRVTASVTRAGTVTSDFISLPAMLLAPQFGASVAPRLLDAALPRPAPSRPGPTLDETWTGAAIVAGSGLRALNTRYRG